LAAGEPFGATDCGGETTGGIEPVGVLSVAAAFAFITDGEASAAAALTSVFFGNRLRLATAERNGLDGVENAVGLEGDDDVVTQPESSDINAGAIKSRAPRTRLLQLRTVFEDIFSNKLMHHNIEIEKYALAHVVHISLPLIAS
jgi:hypothetical protein